MRRIELIALAGLFVFCVTGVSIYAGPDRLAQTPPAAEQNRQLTPQERRGRAIYSRGESLSGRKITSAIGDLEVPASTVNCAGCHGRRAEGKTEGGISAGNLTWGHLIKSYGHTHPTGRKHGPFNESSFIMAVVHGIDPDRNRMAAAMPRYSMSPEDMADLLAYLKRIEFDQDPGVTAESIEIGVPLPSSGPLAEVGTAMREVLSAYFEELNLRGGIYNRKIKLHFTERGDGSINATFVNARALAREGQAFAFVGGVSAGADSDMVLVAGEEEVPFIGPATLLPQTDKPPNRYVFYLMPGAAEQARALINFADTKMTLKKVRAAVLYPQGLLPKTAAIAALDQARLRRWDSVLDRPIAAGSFDARKSVEELKSQQTEALFFFGDSTQTTELLAAANVLDWKPDVFLLATLAGKDIASFPLAFKEKVFLAFPTIPADITAAGAAEYRALLEKYKLRPRHSASQLAALAAAKILVEGLKRTGADLTREQFISALEGLYDFDTGLTPHVIFGPNRRIGASGAYMVKVNSETKEFAAVSGWISSQ